MVQILLFDDNIRSLAARQRLSKGRQRARHLKLQKIAALLDLPANFLQVTAEKDQTNIFNPRSWVAGPNFGGREVIIKPLATFLYSNYD